MMGTYPYDPTLRPRFPHVAMAGRTRQNISQVAVTVLTCAWLVGCDAKQTAHPSKTPPETNVSPSVLNLKRKDFVGRWRNLAGKTTIVLHDNGSAETFMGDTEHYPGTWRFTSPRELLVRAVIPHNDPKIDDELNAHEIVFTIRRFTSDSFTAEEFDWEELLEFSRIDTNTR